VNNLQSANVPTTDDSAGPVTEPTHYFGFVAPVSREQHLVKYIIDRASTARVDQQRIMPAARQTCIINARRIIHSLQVSRAIDLCQWCVR